MAKSKTTTVALNNSKAPSGQLSPTQLSALAKATGQPTPGPFSNPDLSGLNNGANITHAAPTVGTPGPYDQLRQTIAAQLPDVPQSFVDHWVDQQNAKNAASNGGQGTDAQRAQLNDPNYMTYAVNDVRKAWSALPQGTGTGENQGQNRQMYVTADSNRVSNANNQAVLGNAQNIVTQMPGQTAGAINDFYNRYVTPPLQGYQSAVAGQPAVDRAAEARIQSLTNDYTGTINQNQTNRMADIGSTNAGTTNLVNYLAGQAQGTNAANSALQGTYNNELANSSGRQAALYGNLAASNAAGNQFQTGLYNTYAGQAAGINANQTGLYNTLAGQNAASNAQQTALYQTLAGQNSASNAQQNAIVAQFTAQLSQLNAEDRANYMNYLQETNPYMAQLIAQGSDPELVGNQKDVLQRYKELSTPQVTAQERLIAEMARQKFESNDRSSREAVMQQMAGRGLRSGAAVIANQQATRQGLATDRLNAELGLQANAVSRGMEGLAGYGQESNILRNADDAMKQFEDQYKQNEAQRISDLALNRNQSGYQMTNAQTGRAQAGYNAQTQTVEDNSARNQSTYNAGTQTTEDNAARNKTTYDAGTETNNNNDARNQNVFWAGTTTQNNNSARDQNTYTSGTESNKVLTDNAKSAFDTGQLTNTNNFNRTSDVVGTGIKTLADNSTRYQTGLTAGDTTAANTLATQGSAALLPTQNTQTEIANKQMAANTGMTAGTSFSNAQGIIDDAKMKALIQALSYRGLGNAQQQATNSMT